MPFWLNLGQPLFLPCHLLYFYNLRLMFLSRDCFYPAENFSFLPPAASTIHEQKNPSDIVIANLRSKALTHNFLTERNDLFKYVFFGCFSAFSSIMTGFLKLGVNIFFSFWRTC